MTPHGAGGVCFSAPSMQVSLYNPEQAQAQSFNQAVKSGQTWGALSRVIASVCTSASIFRK